MACFNQFGGRGGPSRRQRRPKRHHLIASSRIQLDKAIAEKRLVCKLGAPNIEELPNGQWRAWW